MAGLIDTYKDATALQCSFIEKLGKLDLESVNGFAGSYGTVKRRLRRLRGRQRREFVQRFETGPGRQAQMDFAGVHVQRAAEETGPYGEVTPRAGRLPMRVAGSSPIAVIDGNAASFA